MKKIPIIVLLFLACFNANAQQTPVDSTNVQSVQNIDYENIQLPPIAIFLEAAKSYADIRYLDARIEEENQLLKISQKEWLKYIRLQGNYQYGTNSAYMLQSDEQIPTGVGFSTLNTQSWYNAGVVVSIPLDDLFSRKNKNNVVRSRIQQIQYETDKTLEERQIRILEAYNEVVKNLTLLKVKAEAVALYNAQMKISETDFVNGRIDIITLSLERSRRAEAMVRYQESRADLHNSVTILEMLTKIKIIKN